MRKTASCMTAHMVHVVSPSEKWWLSDVFSRKYAFAHGTRYNSGPYLTALKAGIFLIYNFTETEATEWTAYALLCCFKSYQNISTHGSWPVILRDIDIANRQIIMDSQHVQSVSAKLTWRI